MWSAFTKGFAEGATEAIKERDKEISDRALAEMESLLKKKTLADAKALERRDELRKQANELRARSGNRLTEAQIVGILESGYGEVALEKLKSKTVGADKMAKLFTPASPDDKRLIEDYIKEATTLTGKAPIEVEEEGAFGLRSRAGSAVRQRAAATAGMPVEELYKAELPEMGTKPTGTIDLSIFEDEDEESISNMQDRLIRTVIDPSSSKEEKDSASKTLGEIGGAKALLKAKEEGISFKESDIRANLRNYVATIKERMAGPGNTKRVLNPETNSVDIIYGKTVKPDEIRRIESAADTALNGYINQYYSVSGKIPEPVQRVVATFTARPMAIRVGTSGAGEAAGEVPAPTGKPTKPKGILPAPKTKEEYDAIPSGTRYIDTDGKTKIKS